MCRRLLSFCVVSADSCTCACLYIFEKNGATVSGQLSMQILALMLRNVSSCESQCMFEFSMQAVAKISKGAIESLTSPKEKLTSMITNRI